MKYPLNYSKVGGKYKYRLNTAQNTYLVGFPFSSVHHPFVVMDTQTIHIKAGYAWDGPSGPSIDTDTFMRGSLIHDALYQLIREGYLPQSFRKAADKQMRRICKEDGMHPFRAWYSYVGVRLFGRFYT